MSDTSHSDSTQSPPFGDDSVGYDPTTGTFHSRFEPDSSAIVVAIVETVSTATNRDPAAMSPLFSALDPEALVDLVVSARETPVDVTVSYEGCRVTVSSHGTVTVEPPPE